MTAEIAARLKARNIQWYTRERGYFLFVRDECAAFAQTREGAMEPGSSGIMTEQGFSYLVWREDRPYLAAHGGNEAPASPDQVDAVRRFSEDLKAALALE